MVQERQGKYFNPVLESWGILVGFAFVGEQRTFTVLQIFRNFLATKLSVPSGPNQLDFY